MLKKEKKILHKCAMIITKSHMTDSHQLIYFIGFAYLMKSFSKIVYPYVYCTLAGLITYLLLFAYSYI